MSIYRKFIDSASSQQTQQTHHHHHHQNHHNHQQQQAELDYHHYSNQFEDQQQEGQHSHQHFQQQAPVEQQQQQAAMLKQKSRAHMATLSPLASVVGSTISSTPISKHQYKRLVEASEAQTYQKYQSHCNHYHRVGSSNPIQLQPASQFSHELSRQHQQQQSLSLKNIHLQEQQQQQQQHRQQRISSSRSRANVYQSQECIMSQVSSSKHHHRQRSLFNTDDPVLLKWMQAMRFETELECLTALQARTLAIDEHSAAALSVRNSQVAIQEMRLESDLVLDMIDAMIDSLPINFNTINKLAIDFSEIYVRLMEQTRARTSAAASTTNKTTTSHTYCNQLNQLTIINCTPRKSLVSSRTLRPLDKLAVQIRNICMEMSNVIQEYQENYNSYAHIDNGQFEVMLRKIKELLGKFTEISIRAECANIVRALDHDFSKSCQLTKLASNASLRPVRAYEPSTAQLPLKWALIALWQLTKDDGYICRTLTEKWQASSGWNPTNNTADNQGAANEQAVSSSPAKPGAARRLDYSTKHDNETDGENKPTSGQQEQHSLRSDYERLYQICQTNEQFRDRQQQLQQQVQPKLPINGGSNQNRGSSPQGALSSALKSKQPVKQVSTIELLIEIIIRQPNRHERVDMMNFMQNNKLVDLEDLDQSISAAFYTSNQYKVAALRILNHLCINEQAIKTILRCFSTPPPKQGQPTPENKIIKSIFECYQTAQEHIYQNETMFNVNRTPTARRTSYRKRARHHNHHHQSQQDPDSEEYSDYGSRQTNSVPTSGSLSGLDDNSDDDEGDDAVREAIQLLIQLTTPFYKSAQGHDYYTLIGRFSIESLVKYLTNIIKSTSNRKMLLLSLSALANISFITTEPMKQYGTNRIILEMFRASKSRSKDLELRDQAVTILANTADKNLLDIISNGGLTFLLSCLEICPTRMSNYKLLQEKLKQDVIDPYSNIDEAHDPAATQNSLPRKTQIDNKPRDRKPIDLSDEFLDDLDCACDNQQTMTNMQLSCLSRLSANEMAALERIHQKTAVAFARMSIDVSTTKMVLKYGGVKQMIDLCKLSHKRNHSDTVLIACLAALRKISKVIGRDTFKHYNALDLIELEPERAMEIYGSLYASEV